MSLRNDGFYMAELILSLSGWLLIASILVPLFMQLNKQTLELQEKSDAVHILYEYMQTVIVENPERANNVITKNNTQYELVWQKGEMEVCVRYEDVFRETINLCETVR